MGRTTLIGMVLAATALVFALTLALSGGADKSDGSEVSLPASGLAEGTSPAQAPMTRPIGEGASDISRSALEAGRDADTDARQGSASQEAEAPEPDSSGPEVPDGTSLVGVLVDPAGSAVESATLMLRRPSQERGNELHIECDEGGRFAVAIDVYGDLLITAKAHGVGQSEELAHEISEGSSLDLGEIQLLAVGGLIGRCVFAGSGEPFPGVSVAASAMDRSTSPGLHDGRSTADADGRFELAGLAPGPFQLTVSGENQLPIEGNDVFQSGDEDVEVSLNALLVRAVCVDEAGQTVPLKWIGLSNAPGDTEERAQVARDSSGSASWGFGKPAEEHELILATGRGYVLRARDESWRHFFAFVPPDLRAGIHRVELRENAPGFGALKIELLPSGAGDTIGLVLRELQRGDESANSSVDVTGDMDRAQQLDVKGLWPGEYSGS
ncbi:MAG: carboxypeptidase-like regulatory domain-containing protein, partial [Planctomycetota bacterium]